MAGIPTLYKATAKALSQRALLRSGPVPAKTILVVDTYLDLCGDGSSGFDGIADLRAKLGEGGYGNSQASISMAIKVLLSAGAATAAFTSIPGGSGRRKTVTLKDIGLLVNYYRAQSVVTPTIQWSAESKAIQIQALEDNNIAYLDVSGSAMPRMEKHFSMYDAAMRPGAHDKSKRISIEYFFNKNDSIKITAVTTTDDGDDIAHLSDQRAMRVINGFLYEKIKGDRSFDVGDDDTVDSGYVAFDISKLCRAMGMYPSESNKSAARGMLRRLASTEFRIDAENSPYYRETMGSGADIVHYRYLTEYSAVTSNVDDGDVCRRVETFYKVRVHGDIVKSLLNPRQSYISHPGLACEKNGLAHRLYNWSKAVVGVTARSDKISREYTIDHFRELVLPASRMDNFKRDLLALMAKYIVPVQSSQFSREGEDIVVIKALIYGYFYTVIYDSELYKSIAQRSNRRRAGEMVIMVERNAADELIGDNSDHNKALRREAAEAMLSIDDFLANRPEIMEA